MKIYKSRIMERMRILHIINDLEIGGAQRLLADFLPLMNKQHNIEVLILREKPSPLMQELIDSGIKIHCLKVKSLYNPLTTLRIRRFLKQQPRYDVIHVHLFPSLYWVPLAVIGMHQHLVWTEHSTSNRRQQNPLLRYTDRIAYSRYEKIICISQATCDSLKDRLGAQSDDHLCVIENGIDVNKFKNQKTAERQHKSLIQISRFEASKDQDTVIRAMLLLPKDIHLVFVGDGSRIDICKALCNTLNLQDRVHFLGSRTDIAQLLSNADIAIQSSHWEGFGLAAVEAMAAGLPTIASNVEGLRQVVEGAGLLFPKGDAETLSKLILQILSDSSVYQEISEKCRQRSLLYDIQNTANLYVSIYEEVVEE